MPASSFSFSSLTNLLFRKYSPLVGVSKQPMMFIKVVLPEPDGPVIARNSPALTSKLMPLIASTVSEPTSNERFSSVVLMIILLRQCLYELVRSSCSS